MEIMKKTTRLTMCLLGAALLAVPTSQAALSQLGGEFPLLGDVAGHQKNPNVALSQLGGFVVWFVWIEAAPMSLFLINILTSGLAETNQFKNHLINSVPYFRYLIMGIGLLLIMRYRPRGILPEKVKHI